MSVGSHSSSVFHDETTTTTTACVLHHDASKLGCWTRFRLVGMRAAKSIVTTLADIGGDWLFWYRAVDDPTVKDNIQPYVLDALFWFAVLSSVLGVLLVYSLWRAHRICRQETRKAYEAAVQSRRRKKKLRRSSSSSSFVIESIRELYENLVVTPKLVPRWDACVKWLLGMEVILEDVPQFVLSGMVIVARQGGIDDVPSYVVFNLTTSGFNLLLNVFDMIELEDLSFLVAERKKRSGGGNDRKLDRKGVSGSDSHYGRNGEMNC